jgi:hypothetical protein
MPHVENAGSTEKYGNISIVGPSGRRDPRWRGRRSRRRVTNREGRILETNLTFTSQLGIERGRLINTPLWLYAAAPDRGKLRSHLENRIITHHGGGLGFESLKGEFTKVIIDLPAEAPSWR